MREQNILVPKLTAAEFVRLDRLLINTAPEWRKLDPAKLIETIEANSS